MIVLHGSWLPQSDPATHGRFFLWAEAEAQPAPRRGRRPRLSANVARPHPGQVGVAELRVAWRELAPEVALTGDECAAVVWLPSVGGRPQMAPELVGVADAGAVLERPAGNLAEGPLLAAWMVSGMALPAAEALRLLAALPAEAGDEPGAVHEPPLRGSDLAYWSQAAKLALELLARQRYLPAVVPVGDGGCAAAWTPYVEDPADRARAERLARAMPPLCRAMKRLRVWPVRDSKAVPERPARSIAEGPLQLPQQAQVILEGLPGARALLDGFLAAVVDGAVRRWGTAGRRHARTAATDIALQWRDRLLDARPATPMREAGAVHEPPLLDGYSAWLGQLAGGGDRAFRICFRLEPPDAEDGGAADRWALRYLLQASDDPSLLVPAEAVWRERGSALHYLNRRFDEPQERLLAGLGRASRIVPAVEQSLQQARPAECALTTAEAYGFLRESAPLLESAGFGLLVPPWWNKRGARLGLRLHVAPSPAAASSGILGLDSLVQYNWQLSLGEESLPLEEFLRLADLKVPLVRVRGQWVEMRPDQVDAVLRFWQAQAQRPEGTLAEAMRLAQAAGQGGDGTPLPVSGVSAEGWVAELLERLAGREPLEVVPPPAGFHGELRPYQVSGVSWLAFLHRWGLGACLADDMGLGKTIQVLALLLRLKESGEQADGSPTLLVCPMSAVGNWEREAARFAPRLRVLVHHGLERQSGAEFQEAATRHDLVISTYSLLHRDEETLAGVDWAGVILDEAQNIKNPATRQAQAARRLTARYRIALTGTPVENRLSELWSIMEFLNRGYLGSQAQFRRRFALPIERYHEPEPLARLKAQVRPFLLRRVKSDPQVIRDLPLKLEQPVYYRLTQEQATMYQAVVRDAMEKIESSEGIERRGLVLSMLLKLKQVCNHPAQFLGDGSALAGRSGKLARLTEMLEEALAEGDRALVFTQFSVMGEMLRRHLQAELRREVLFLHGAVTQPQRERMIARFQDDPQGPPIFVLSLKAGGTALNLMRANHVFHFDRWWNPAVENQATDRAYRIGQTQNVLVHKFVCLGTLEERIAELIESKRALAENVVESGEGWLTELSTEQLRELLVLRQDAVE